jgi:hypothetical protein
LIGDGLKRQNDAWFEKPTVAIEGCEFSTLQSMMQTECTETRPHGVSVAMEYQRKKLDHDFFEPE